MKKFLIGNWKMNMDLDQSISLINDLNTLYNQNFKTTNVEIILAPTFPLLLHAKTNSPFKICAQNTYFENSGSYTGEVSSSIIKSLGTEYVIVGHSERRKYFNETNETISQKIKSVIDNSLIPILCIGETWELREKNKHLEFLKNQLKECLSKIDKKEINNIIIAYEPIWAIGTNQIPTAKEIENIHLFIIETINLIFGIKHKLVTIIYGGNLNKDNASDILTSKHVNGGLIGRASLDANSFLEIINCF
ncbi:MAG: triose-phosphate isomerase [Bacteroidetes bacterium]|nr:triose-phosphate isomerase [Bacteroidota bacterium]